MGTETFNKGTPSPNMKVGNQKKGEQVRGSASPEYQQVNGGKQGYPNTNGAESLNTDKFRSSQKPKFARTAEGPLTGKAWCSGESNNKDYKKGGRKGFGTEKSGPDIRKGKGAAYV